MTRPVSDIQPIDRRTLSEQIERVIAQERRPVSVRWLSFEAAITAAKARHALQTYMDTHRGEVSATYVVTGACSASRPQACLEFWVSMQQASLTLSCLNIPVQITPGSD
jgi:hypothetical protein